MLSNYLKAAWRNLIKSRFYSMLNIAGLSLGLAVGILILLWVQDENSYDAYHKNADNIYRVSIRGGTGASKQIFDFGVAPIVRLAKEQLPEVTSAARMSFDVKFSVFKYQEKAFADCKLAFADPSIFSLMDYPLLEGNNTQPFSDDRSIVITRSTARKFFGNQDAVGKVIVADGQESFRVTGVIADIPVNSNYKADIFIPMNFHVKEMLAQGKDIESNFEVLDYVGFVAVKPGASIAALQSKILQIHLRHNPADTDADYLLLPIKKMHLYTADGGDRGIGNVRIFIAIALLILVIACINYVNLATARAMLRSKEISMRKIVGAGKAQLFAQFLTETALLFLIAALCAVGIAEIAMPLFNQVTGKQMLLDLNNPQIWTVIAGTIGGTLVLSSIYPALLLSSFEPLKALKGRIVSGIGDRSFRKVLVVTQFSFSILLIIGTLVITAQLKFIQSKDLGYEKDHVLSLWMRDMGPHYDAVKAELMKLPGVSGVTRSNQNIVRFGGFTGTADWDGKNPEQNLIANIISIDKDFIPLFKIKMLEGSGFTGQSNDSAHFILNETAVHETGIKDPIGKRFSLNGVKGTIIGVVKDYHHASMRERISPTIFFYRPQYWGTMYIKTTGKDLQQTIKAAEAQFKQYNTDYPFGYSFLDEVFNYLYQREQQQATLFNYFAAIAIFISCLGLLGLATYTIQVRTREIGVRRVLGASTVRITTMLSADFLKLVLVAVIIASVAGWWLMQKWLEDFAYRINIQWWMFFMAGASAMVIAILTISFQAIRASLANPVKTLRSE